MEPTTRPFLCPRVRLDVVEVDYAYLLVFCRREMEASKGLLVYLAMMEIWKEPRRVDKIPSMEILIKLSLHAHEERVKPLACL